MKMLSKDKVLQKIDGIWDCNDMVFEPNNICATSDHCSSCKWLETKNAIRKMIDGMEAVEAVPIEKGYGMFAPVVREWRCTNCNTIFSTGSDEPPMYDKCPWCGKEMRG